MRLGVNQGAVLSSLFFVILLKALSMAFRTDCSLQLLHADDLMIFTIEALMVKVEKWKSGKQKNGLRVNMGNT